MLKNKIAVLVCALIAASALVSCGTANENTDISTGSTTEKVTEETAVTEVTEAETELSETSAVTEVSTEAVTTSAETTATDAAQTSEAVTETVSDDSYKAAYLETCRSLAETEGKDMKFELVDIDGDKVPELAAGNEGYWVSLYTYADGKVFTVMDHCPYGAMGNTGYEFLPGQNCIHNSNADHAGMIRYETYMKINDSHELETVRTIEADYFDDKNGNHEVDEDGADTYNEDGHFFIGNEEITAEEFAEYQKGDYKFINGTKTLDEIKAEL